MSLAPSKAAAADNETWTFDYTGKVQQVTLSPGKYLLEVWGAKGGDETYNGLKGYGGNGGYASGELNLDEEKTIYVVVGGAGGDLSGGHATGGYNGGGTGGTTNRNGFGAGGGGATHMAFVSGELKTLETQKEQILIVAGGGGGTDAGVGPLASGGEGGGLKGGDVLGGVHYGRPGKDIAYGGTQTGPGHTMYANSEHGRGGFGYGGNAANSSCPHCASGGGSGWYGGGPGNGSEGAGGGSGHINEDVLQNGQMESGVREGHGYAQITSLAAPDVYISNTQSVNGGSKTTDAIDVEAGDVITYSLTASNEGNADASAYSIADAIPSGLLYIDGSATDDGEYADGAVSWELSDLPFGENKTVSFDVRVPSTANDATWLNKGHVTCTSTTRVSEIVTAKKHGGADISLEKRQSIESIDDVTSSLETISGQTVRYSIKVTNNGAGAARDLVVTDLVTSGLTVASDSVTDGGTLGQSGAGQQITWNIGDLQSGEYITLYFDAVIPDSDLDANWENVAQATYSDANKQTLSATSNKVDISKEGQAAFSPSLLQGLTPDGWGQAISAGKGDLTVKAGDIVDFTLSGKNEGKGPAYGAWLTMKVPDGMIVAESVPTDAMIDGNIISWRLGTVAEGATYSKNVSLIVPQTVSVSDWQPSYSITFNHTNISDFATAASNTLSIHEDGQATLGSAILHALNDGAFTVSSIDDMYAGDIVYYELDVDNSGYGTAHDVEVSMEVAGDLEIIGQWQWDEPFERLSFDDEDPEDGDATDGGEDEGQGGDEPASIEPNDAQPVTFSSVIDGIASVLTSLFFGTTESEDDDAQPEPGSEEEGDPSSEPQHVSWDLGKMAPDEIKTVYLAVKIPTTADNTTWEHGFTATYVGVNSREPLAISPSSVIMRKDGAPLMTIDTFQDVNPAIKPLEDVTEETTQSTVATETAAESYAELTEDDDPGTHEMVDVIGRDVIEYTTVIGNDGAARARKASVELDIPEGTELVENSITITHVNVSEGGDDEPGEGDEPSQGDDPVGDEEDEGQGGDPADASDDAGSPIASNDVRYLGMPPLMNALVTLSHINMPMWSSIAAADADLGTFGLASGKHALYKDRIRWASSSQSAFYDWLSTQNKLTDKTKIWSSDALDKTYPDIDEESDELDIIAFEGADGKSGTGVVLEKITSLAEDEIAGAYAKKAKEYKTIYGAFLRDVPEAFWLSETFVTSYVTFEEEPVIVPDPEEPDLGELEPDEEANAAGAPQSSAKAKVSVAPDGGCDCDDENSILSANGAGPGDLEDPEEPEEPEPDPEPVDPTYTLCVIMTLKSDTHSVRCYDSDSAILADKATMDAVYEDLITNHDDELVNKSDYAYARMFVQQVTTYTVSVASAVGDVYYAAPSALIASYKNATPIAYAKAIKYLLDKKGIDSFISTQTSPSYTWLGVKLGSKWYAYDFIGIQEQRLVDDCLGIGKTSLLKHVNSIDDLVFNEAGVIKLNNEPDLSASDYEVATPTCVPPRITAEYGTTLSDIEIPNDVPGNTPGHWEWANPFESCSTMGEVKFKANFIPDDGDTYCKITNIDVTVTVVSNNSGITAKLSTTHYTYNGEEHRPTVTVFYEDGKKVMSSDQYVVTYVDNVEIGTACAVIVPSENSNFEFEEIRLPFTIVRTALADITVFDDAVDGHHIYGDRYQLSVSGDQEGTVIYEIVEGPISMVSGNVFTTTGIGDATVKATKNVEGFAPVSATYTFKINPRPVAVSAVSVNDKDYDGTRIANVGDFSIGNVLNGDVDEVGVACSAYFVDSAVGQDKVVNISFALSGAKKSLYAAPQSQSATASISKRQITDAGAIRFTVSDQNVASGTLLSQIATPSAPTSTIDGSPIIGRFAWDADTAKGERTEDGDVILSYDEGMTSQMIEWTFASTDARYDGTINGRARVSIIAPKDKVDFNDSEKPYPYPDYVANDDATVDDEAAKVLVDLGHIENNEKVVITYQVSAPAKEDPIVYEQNTSISWGDTNSHDLYDDRTAQLHAFHDGTSELIAKLYQRGNGGDWTQDEITLSNDERISLKFIVANESNAIARGIEVTLPVADGLIEDAGSLSTSQIVDLYEIAALSEDDIKVTGPTYEAVDDDLIGEDGDGSGEGDDDPSEGESSDDESQDAPLASNDAAASDADGDQGYGSGDGDADDDGDVSDDPDGSEEAPDGDDEDLLLMSPLTYRKGTIYDISLANAPYALRALLAHLESDDARVIYGDGNDYRISEELVGTGDTADADDVKGDSDSYVNRDDASGKWDGKGVVCALPDLMPHESMEIILSAVAPSAVTEDSTYEHGGVAVYVHDNMDEGVDGLVVTSNTVIANQHPDDPMPITGMGDGILVVLIAAALSAVALGAHRKLSSKRA